FNLILCQKKRRDSLLSRQGDALLTALLLSAPALVKTRSWPFSGLFCLKKILSSAAGMDTAPDMEMIRGLKLAAKIEAEKLRR
ncbi:MAG: hypothetical protein KBG12_00540, partial [Syntrophobacterales bacterium]|nr:hypothetical protein [Syntrophobacterales bacterium]